MFYKDERAAIFIDGQNLYAAARALNFDVDYKRLLETFRAKCRLVRASYFTPVADTDDHVAIRPLVDFLAYNGWNVVAKPAKIYEDENGRKRIKGNTDIEMAVAAMKMAPNIDHAALFTGNRDFAPLITFLQECGVRVTVVSSLRTQPPMASDDLRRAADSFVELDALRDAIARPPRDGAAA